MRLCLYGNLWSVETACVLLGRSHSREAATKRWMGWSLVFFVWQMLRTEHESMSEPKTYGTREFTHQQRMIYQTSNQYARQADDLEMPESGQSRAFGPDGCCPTCKHAEPSVYCAAVACAIPACAPGGEIVTKPGDCCPSCTIPLGPVSCANAGCAVPVCEGGAKPVTPPGGCCPRCPEQPVVVEPPIDPCQPQGPFGSQIACAYPICEDGAKPITKKGDCCPSCPPPVIVPCPVPGCIDPCERRKTSFSSRYFASRDRCGYFQNCVTKPGFFASGGRKCPSCSEFDRCEPMRYW